MDKIRTDLEVQFPQSNSQLDQITDFVFFGA